MPKKYTEKIKTLKNFFCNFMKVYYFKIKMEFLPLARSLKINFFERLP